MIVTLEAGLSANGKENLGYKVVRTTMGCTRVVNRGGRRVDSPADILTRQPDEEY
jgi:hypothetical protein